MKQHLFLRILRKFLRDKSFSYYNFAQAEYKDETGCDFIYNRLKDETPCMISKFGTMEFNFVLSYYLSSKGRSLNDYWEYVRGRVNIFEDQNIGNLCSNAGFFSRNLKEDGKKYAKLVLKDIQEIDILGSYIQNERYLSQFLHCKTVNLDAFYAPFMFENPWSRVLKGKKVLVVHPFVDSIRAQYENNRMRLFDNDKVLPEFKKLITVRAVQSIANNKVPYDSWFEALEAMEKEIESKDFDIAIIGCGAYGMNLAAFVKRLGKQAIHLAGWTQMLFGVYGSRWLNDQPQYSKFINKYWIRPMETEKPQGANNIENGCYW